MIEGRRTWGFTIGFRDCRSEEKPSRRRRSRQHLPCLSSDGRRAPRSQPRHRRVPLPRRETPLGPLPPPPAGPPGAAADPPGPARRRSNLWKKGQKTKLNPSVFSQLPKVKLRLLLPSRKLRFQQLNVKAYRSRSKQYWVLLSVRQNYQFYGISQSPFAWYALLMQSYVKY